MNNLKIHFHTEYQLQNAINPNQSSQGGGYHHLHTAEEEALDTLLKETMQNFANVSTADQEAFAALTTTNNHLKINAQTLANTDATMQAHLSNMQQQMAMMAVTNNNNQGSYCSCKKVKTRNITTSPDSKVHQ